MSGVIKKVFKSVKKVFKKIVKAVKKVVKSKLFKVVVLAAAVFFTAGAAIPALTGGAAATGAAAGTAAGTAAAGAGTAAMTTSVGAATTAATTTAATTAATAATATKGLLGTVGAWASSNPLLASTALNAGGSILSGIGARKEAEKAEKDQRKREEQNANTYLPVYDETYKSLQESGYYDNSTTPQSALKYAKSDNSAPAQNVEAKPAHFFDNSSNEWKPAKPQVAQVQPQGGSVAPLQQIAQTPRKSEVA